ncbi:MAG: SpoIIE family protein phosphatase, partial [Fibrobacteres bacterium]|nr:SpoIIE family protein phosphatase [Fibrobacterota bacterium]
DPLFYKSLGDEKYRLINPNGCAIGVSRGSFASRLEEEELDLKPCDTIALTTDGINEATSKDGTIFGEDKMYTHLSDNECAGPRELLERLTSALTTHYGDSEPSDDATIVILKVKEKKDA